MILLALEKRVASLLASFRGWGLPEFEPPFLLQEGGISMPLLPQLLQLTNLGRIPGEVKLPPGRVCLCALPAAQEPGSAE